MLRLGRKEKKKNKERVGIYRRQHSKMFVRLSTFVLAFVCTCIVVLIVHINYYIEQVKSKSVNGAEELSVLSSR